MTDVFVVTILQAWCADNCDLLANCVAELLTSRCPTVSPSKRKRGQGIESFSSVIVFYKDVTITFCVRWIRSTRIYVFRERIFEAQSVVSFPKLLAFKKYFYVNSSPNNWKFVPKYQEYYKKSHFLDLQKRFLKIIIFGLYRYSLVLWKYSSIFEAFLNSIKKKWIVQRRGWNCRDGKSWKFYQNF